jgi:hypothetical protein
MKTAVRATAIITTLCAILAFGFIGGYLVGNMQSMQRRWPSDLYLLVAHYKGLEAGKADNVKHNLGVLISAKYRSIQLHSNNPLFYLAQLSEAVPEKDMARAMKEAEVICNEVSKTLVPSPTQQQPSKMVTPALPLQRAVELAQKYAEEKGVLKSKYLGSVQLALDEPTHTKIVWKIGLGAFMDPDPWLGLASLYVSMDGEVTEGWVRRAEIPASPNARTQTLSLIASKIKYEP